MDALKPCFSGAFGNHLSSIAIRGRCVECIPGWLTQGHSHIQCTNCQIPFHTIADGPANDTARVQIQNHRQINQPSLVHI